MQLSGFGKKFFSDVLETLQLISKFPHSFTIISEHTNRAVLKKFPYNLIYSILDNKIYIIAVAHQNRAPEYWINRMFKYE
jgi:hypothetical protein